MDVVGIGTNRLLLLGYNYKLMIATLVYLTMNLWFYIILRYIVSSIEIQYLVLAAKQRPDLYRRPTSMFVQLISPLSMKQDCSSSPNPP